MALKEDRPALDAGTAEAVCKIVGVRYDGSPVRVKAVLSVHYSIDIGSSNYALTPYSQPGGARETLRRAAAACASKACRLCGKETDDTFVQSTVDGSWFCSTCVTDASIPAEGA